MPEKTFFALINEIESTKGQYPINVLYGFNEFLGETIIQKFSEQFLPEKTDFNYRRFYFDNEEESSWEEIVQTAQSASFFIQSQKLVVVTIRQEKYLGLSKGDKEIIKKYLLNPNLNTVFIIYISIELSKDEYKLLRKAKLAGFIKEFNVGQSIMIDLDKIYERDLKLYLKKILKKKNITITEDALEKIIELKGDDLASVISQLPKFEIFQAADSSIDSADIDKILTGIEAHSIWELTEAIENQDANKYQKVLNYLFLNGIKPNIILGTLITHYNKIYIAKFLLKHKFSASDIGKVLNQPVFFLEKFIRSVRNFAENKITTILDIIYRLDYDSKTSGEDITRLLLQNFIFQVKMLSS